MKVKENFISKIDFILIIPAFLLVVFGLFALKSATNENILASGNYDKQVFFIFIAFVAFIFSASIPSRFYKLIALPAFGISLFLLLYVLFAGKTVSGAKSWISLGPIGFQPAEFSKIAYILFISYWLTRKNVNINEPKYLGLTILFSIFPIGLILAEPDLGTVVVYSAILLAYLFWSGINLFGLFIILSPPTILFLSLFGVIPALIGLILVLLGLFYFKRDIFLSLTIFITNLSSIFLFDFALKFLKPHQQQRILTFLNPAADPLGSGYNALQAQIAIGSGGLFGKGFLEGTQTQMRFIPEQWTDFIFSVVGEEFGFIGSIIILGLFSIILFRLLYLATRLKNSFESFITIGILTIFLFHFFINIGMNIGLAPIIGIPLPFISYGGTAMLTYSVMIGIVVSFYRTNKEHV